MNKAERPTIYTQNIGGSEWKSCSAEAVAMCLDDRDRDIRSLELELCGYKFAYTGNLEWIDEAKKTMAEQAETIKTLETQCKALKKQNDLLKRNTKWSRKAVDYGEPWRKMRFVSNRKSGAKKDKNETHN